MERSAQNGRSWVGWVVRGFAYAAFIYVASLIVMPSSALGLTPQQMVLASIGAGLGMALFFARRK